MGGGGFTMEPSNPLLDDYVLSLARRPLPRILFLPTASGDPTAQINSMRSTVRVRSRDKRTFHAPIGTRDMAPEDIAENLDFLMRRVLVKLERGRFNIQSAYVKTTMGPAVRYL